MIKKKKKKIQWSDVDILLMPRFMVRPYLSFVTNLREHTNYATKCSLGYSFNMHVLSPHFFFFFDGSPVPTLMSQPTSRFEPLNNVIKSGPLRVKSELWSASQLCSKLLAIIYLLMYLAFEKKKKISLGFGICLFHSQFSPSGLIV